MEKDNYTIIEKYLNGELNEEEVNNFKKRLEEDAAFADEYNLQKSMNIFLEKKNNQPALEATLNTLGNDFFQEESNSRSEKVIPINKTKSRNRWIIGLVASAAIAAILIMFNPFQSSDLYQQYASHQSISLTEKSTDNKFATKAETAFNQQNYSLAYQNLTSYLQENPEDQKAKLAFGISALEIGKINEAQATFNEIKSGNSALKNYGTWYLALSYLKQKDFVATKNLLNQIPPSEKELFNKSQTLINELN